MSVVHVRQYGDAINAQRGNMSVVHVRQYGDAIDAHRGNMSRARGTRRLKGPTDEYSQATHSPFWLIYYTLHITLHYYGGPRLDGRSSYRRLERAQSNKGRGQGALSSVQEALNVHPDSAPERLCGETARITAGKSGRGVGLRKGQRTQATAADAACWQTAARRVLAPTTRQPRQP
eukprot:349724-Chlamydomonas_euryale.AAC.2